MVAHRTEFDTRRVSSTISRSLWLNNSLGRRDFCCTELSSSLMRKAGRETRPAYSTNPASESLAELAHGDAHPAGPGRSPVTRSTRISAKEEASRLFTNESTASKNPCWNAGETSSP